jgi:hypothetical protein
MSMKTLSGAGVLCVTVTSQSRVDQARPRAGANTASGAAAMPSPARERNLGGAAEFP